MELVYGKHPEESNERQETQEAGQVFWMHQTNPSPAYC